MKLSVAALTLLATSAQAFTTATAAGRRVSTSRNIVPGETSAAGKLEQIEFGEVDPAFDKLVKSNFPGAITNRELVTRVTGLLEEKGFTPENTLVATSLCADELARVLEDELVEIYGQNFNLGGLSGFPFAGNTGWGAMSAHVPDNGYCLTVHGPHV